MLERKFFIKTTKLFITAAVVGASAGTLSFFNLDTYAEGPVDIEIVEMSDDGSGNLTPWQDITDAMPGETYSAIPRVINRGNIDVSVRICLARSGQSSSGESIVVTNEQMAISFEPGWTKESDIDCYNYNDVLSPNELTDPLFSSVKITEQVGNEYQNSTFRLHIYAEAMGDIQPTPAESPDTGFFTSNASMAVTISLTMIALIGATIYSLKKVVRKR